MTASLIAQQVEGYLLSKPETSVNYPFGDDVKVFRVKGELPRDFRFARITGLLQSSF